MTSLREVVSTRLPVRYGADFTMRLFRTESVSELRREKI